MTTVIYSAKHIQALNFISLQQNLKGYIVLPFVNRETDLMGSSDGRCVERAGT